MVDDDLLLPELQPGAEDAEAPIPTFIPLREGDVFCAVRRVDLGIPEEVEEQNKGRRKDGQELSVDVLVIPSPTFAQEYEGAEHQSQPSSVAQPDEY